MIASWNTYVALKSTKNIRKWEKTRKTKNVYKVGYIHRLKFSSENRKSLLFYRNGYYYE
jgi:hypothetical protein